MTRFGEWIEVRRLRREYLAAITKNPQPVVLSPLPDPDTVTIEISREDAEELVRVVDERDDLMLWVCCGPWTFASELRLKAKLQAALRGEK